MKIYTKQNVFEAGLDRIRYLFDEFPNVIVGISGGKDSTVTLNMALKVAEEKGRLPLKVLFTDQEAEWGTVIDHIREVMSDPRVEPLWLQMPIRLFNATSHTEYWLHCWEEGKQWIREKEPNSYKVNKYGTDRFADLFGKFIETEYPDQKTCYLAGVRAEESPTRFVSLTSQAKYKHITYGKCFSKKREHYTFYPLYDWSYTDVWKAIHDNGWSYCKIYDYMYQYGVPVKDMRVSNVHHETAIKSLYYLQEIEADTWNRLTARLSGINTAGQMKEKIFQPPKVLPYMFSDWKEYRDYLLDHMVDDVEIHKRFKNHFANMDARYKDMKNIEALYNVQIVTILANDYFFTKCTNWERTPEVYNYRKFLEGKININTKDNKYING